MKKQRKERHDTVMYERLKEYVIVIILAKYQYSATLTDKIQKFIISHITKTQSIHNTKEIFYLTRLD